MFLGFLENLLESGNLFCSATAMTKTALGTIQLWFNYFRGILVYTFPGRLMCGSWFIHSCLHILYGAINLLIFRHLSKRHAT